MGSRRRSEQDARILGTDDAMTTAELWANYYRACLANPEVVAGVELVLGDLGRPSITARQATDALTGHGATYDQVVRVLTALCELGVVKPRQNAEYVVLRAEYADSRPQRAAALGALAWAAGVADESGECELLVAAPGDPPAMVGDDFRRRFLDLRTAIRSMIASARFRVLLASPFWDLEVATDLAEILRRRQLAGVQVAVLARQPQPGTTNERALSALRQALPESSGCQIRILEQPSRDDPFGSSTFHFKAVCADSEHVYLGSANLNTAGLGSRWELGVRLGGSRARRVTDLIEMLIAVSRPY